MCNCRAWRTGECPCARAERRRVEANRRHDRLVASLRDAAPPPAKPKLLATAKIVETPAPPAPTPDFIDVRMPIRTAELLRRIASKVTTRINGVNGLLHELDDALSDAGITDVGPGSISVLLHPATGASNLGIRFLDFDGSR